MAFLKHDIISKDEVFVNSIPFFVSGFGTKLPKVRPSSLSWFSFSSVGGIENRMALILILEFF